MLAVIFLTIFCTGVSADCYIPPSPSAEAFFNVAEKKFSVTSYSDKAGWGTRIVFYPKDGASFDLSTGEISVNIELNMDCGPRMCSGMAWGGYSMDDYCEDNGGRISCLVSEQFPSSTCSGSPPINSTCLPNGHTTSVCLGISAQVNGKHISTNWGFDSRVHRKSLRIENSTSMMMMMLSSNNNTKDQQEEAK